MFEPGDDNELDQFLWIADAAVQAVNEARGHPHNSPAMLANLREARKSIDDTIALCRATN